MIDTGLYRQILEQCFPNLSLAGLDFIGGGTFRVFEAKTSTLPDGRLIFRFPHGYEGGALLQREQRICDLLRPPLPFPIPHYTYYSEGCPLFEYPVGGYRKLEGNPLQECGLAQPALKEVATQLGAFLSVLHSVHLKGAQTAAIQTFSSTKSRDSVRTFYAEIQQRVFAQLSGTEQAWTRALFEPYLAEENNWDYEPVLVHGDFDSSNILYDPIQGQVAGIIDFEEACLGDPAWDFCVLAAEYGPEFLERLLLAYDLPLDAGFRQRVAFHSKRILFHELLYGIQEDARAFFDHGRVRLRRAMAGLEPMGGWLAASTSETRRQEGYPV